MSIFGDYTSVQHTKQSDQVSSQLRMNNFLQFSGLMKLLSVVLLCQGYLPFFPDVYCTCGRAKRVSVASVVFPSSRRLQPKESG